MGARAEVVQEVLPREVETVMNPQWATTHPSDSLRYGLAALSVRGPGFVVPVDTPPAHPQTLQRLLAVGPPAVPVDAQQQPGHPVLIGEVVVQRILTGPVPGGLRTLLGDAQQVVVDDPWVAQDFDEPAAFTRFAEQWSG